MDERQVEYFHLPASSPLPPATVIPRRVLVIIQQAVDPLWQETVSRWIVDSGCLFMMAWGLDCSSWDDSVDHAALEKFNYEEIPDDEFVMTTWHDDEPLSQAFFFARLCAFHATIDLSLLTIVDINAVPRERAILGLYEAEKADLLEDNYFDPRDRPFLTRLKDLIGWQ